jgi:hypothetical protein
LATGAPYSGPNKEGAIYIFRGGPNGIDEFPSQVILARNVDPKLRGFGFSVSGSVDLDGNGYPGVGAIKLCFSRHPRCHENVIVFVPGRPFLPSLMSTGKARTHPRRVQVLHSVDWPYP